VILEAMACGRPVVATRAGAIPELVDESVGVLAEPLDAASLADSIAALYDRDVEALGRAARARVQERYTWSRALPLQLATYAQLFGLAHAPGATTQPIELRSTH
jgi:alpha-1,6-mannosyltransferase